MSKEAVEEDKAYLESREQFINISGKLKYGIHSDIAEMALFNLTGGLEQ